MKDQALNGKDSISVRHFSTRFRGGCDSSLIYVGSAALLIREFMNGTVRAVIKARLSLSSSD